MEGGQINTKKSKICSNLFFISETESKRSWAGFVQPLSKETASYQSTRYVLNVFSSRSFLLHQLHCSFIGLKQREMEMEEGSARVSWYESQLLIGPNNFFHRLVCTGVDPGRFSLVLVD